MAYRIHQTAVKGIVLLGPLLGLIISGIGVLAPGSSDKTIRQLFLFANARYSMKEKITDFTF